MARRKIPEDQIKGEVDEWRAVLNH